MGSIRLHPKYGVNPTLAVCLFCRKERGDLALLGASYHGEAPMRMVIDQEPCEACKAKFREGVALFEGDRHFNARTGQHEFKFTGRYMVVKDEAVGLLFKPDELVQQVLRERKAVVDPVAWGKLNEWLEEVPE